MEDKIFLAWAIFAFWLVGRVAVAEVKMVRHYRLLERSHRAHTRAVRALVNICETRGGLFADLDEPDWVEVYAEIYRAAADAGLKGFNREAVDEQP